MFLGMRQRNEKLGKSLPRRPNKTSSTWIGKEMKQIIEKGKKKI
jgi:hypothetical protein